MANKFFKVIDRYGEESLHGGVWENVTSNPTDTGNDPVGPRWLENTTTGDKFFIDALGRAEKLGSSDVAYSKMLFVDPINGNDTTGTGSDNNMFKTIAKALTVANGSGYRIVLGAGIYAENPTISLPNIDIVTVAGSDRGNTVIQGTVTFTHTSSSSGIQGIAMTNLVHSGAGALYVTDCQVNTLLNKTSTGYIEVTDTQLQGTSTSTLSAGTGLIKDSLIANMTISGASSGYTLKSNIIDANGAVTYTGGAFYNIQDNSGNIITTAGTNMETGLIAQGLSSALAKQYVTDFSNKLGMINPDSNASPTKFVTYNETTRRLEISDKPTGGGNWATGTVTPTATGNTASSLGVASLPTFYENTTTGIRYYIDANGVSKVIERASLTTTSLTPVYYTTSWVNADNTTSTKVAKLMKLSDGSLVDDVDVTWTGHGLDVGEIYYLDSVSGGYTKTPPSSPNYTQQLFIVKDANTIHIDIEQAYVASATDLVTFGTTDPTSPSATANEGDIYFKTSDGTSNGTVISTFVYDKTSNKWVAASASSEITTTSLAPKTGNGTAYVNPTLVSDNTLVDVIELSDGSKLHTGQVTWTNHGLPIHTYFYASATAPFYTATEPTTGYSQQIFYTIDANHIAIDIEQGTLLSGLSSNPTYMVTAYSTINDPLPGAYTIQVNKYNVVDLANTLGGAGTAFNTSTYRFTPTKAGWYDVTIGYDVFRGSTTEGYIILRKNGAIIASVGGFGAVKQNVSKVVYMNGTTDYLDGANQGGAAVTRQQNAVNSFIQAKWLHD